MSAAARRGLLAFLIGLLVIAGGVVADYWRMTREASEGGTTPAGLAIGGPFTLTDQLGRTRRPEDFRGKLMLVYFGYTYCPDACPTTLQAITAALEKLGPRAAEVQPIFITVDPERDTPAQLKAYAENFDPRLVALTGTPEEIAAVAKEYRVYYQKAKPDGAGDYLMDHSSFLYLMGRDGRYLAHLPGDAAPETLSAALAARL